MVPRLAAVEAHERARREVLMLQFHCRPDERAPYRRATNYAPRALSRLLVVCLHRCAAEVTPDRAGYYRRVEYELHPTLLRGPCQDLARPEFLHADRARRRLHRRPLPLWAGANLEVLLDTALTEDVPGGIDRGRPPRQELSEGARQVDCDASFHSLLVKTLLHSEN